MTRTTAPAPRKAGMIMSQRTIAAAALVCGLALTASACASSEPEEEAASQSPQEEATALPPIETQEGRMPDVTGRDLHEAILALREVGLLYEMEGEGFDAEAEAQSTRDWEVVEQSPAAEADVERRDTVQLTVERRG